MQEQYGTVLICIISAFRCLLNLQKQYLLDYEDLPVFSKTYGSVIQNSLPSVADPDPVLFYPLDPGSGMSFSRSRIPDPRGMFLVRFS
jgi:hypothetical protein